MDFYKLFNDFIKFGFKVRSSKLDGLQEWRDKSASLNDTEKIGEWKTSRKIVESEHGINTLQDNYNYVHDNLNMKGDDDDNKINLDLWQQYHFCLQLIRIPKKSLCTTKKIAQIGYNIGQFMASFGCGNYSEQVINYFHLNKLDNLDSYVDFSDTNITTSSESNSDSNNFTASSDSNNFTVSSDSNNFTASSDSNNFTASSDINNNSLRGGNIEYNINVFNKYLSMTSSKNKIHLNNSICLDCKTNNKCTTCGTEYINVI